MQRGVTQLEMVLAFILFIAALGGSILFLQTFRAQADHFAQADLWAEKILTSVEDDVIVTSFALNRSAIGTSSLIAFTLVESSLNTGLLNSSGGLIPSDHQGPLLIFNPNQSTDRGSIVQSSSLVESGTFPDVAPLSRSYLLGAPAPRRIVAEQKIEALQAQLASSPSRALTSLGLPSSLSLRVDFTSPELTLTSSVVPPTDREVRTITRRTEVMTSEGSFIFGTLQITLW